MFEFFEIDIVLLENAHFLTFFKCVPKAQKRISKSKNSVLWVIWSWHGYHEKAHHRISIWNFNMCTHRHMCVNQMAHETFWYENFRRFFSLGALIYNIFFSVGFHHKYYCRIMATFFCAWYPQILFAKNPHYFSKHLINFAIVPILGYWLQFSFNFLIFV